MALPVIVNGTVTVRPEAADNCAVMVRVATDSSALDTATVKATVGNGSLSRMVRVWVVTTSSVALVGAPRVTTTVSSSSFRASPMMVTVMVPPAAPAGMTSGEAVME